MKRSERVEYYLWQIDVVGGKKMERIRPRILRVLLIVDEQDDAKRIGNLLSLAAPASRHKCAFNLKEAVEIAEHTAIDLAIVDASCGGRRCLVTISRFHQRAPNIPIVVITGDRDPELELRIIEAGAHDFLARRNVNSDSLASSIRYALDRQAASLKLRQIEAELAHMARLNTISDMASTVIHELTQPLSVVGNLAVASLNRLQSNQIDRVEENTRMIAEASQHAAETIQRLRNFVRRGDLEQSTSSLENVIRDATRLVEHEARQARISLVLQIADNLPAVTIDAVQIQQVVLNLIRNATQAIGETDTGREIKITVAAKEPGFVETSICDSGRGIDLESPEDLFAPYYTSRTNGMGLGLSICRTIVEAHGGSIFAERNPGRGMTFRFVLPVACNLCLAER